MDQVGAMTTVGRYLAGRLVQLGVRHIFGLPGDYNLALLEELLAGEGLEWVGTANELNAAYAADGYARQRGFAAVLTTFGVGELSALNGIAGSYAESVPVLQVTGSPGTALMQSGALVHHTLADHDFAHFRRAYQEVTVSCEVLSRRQPAAQIDQVLEAMLGTSKPGYLNIPADLARFPVSASRLSRPLARPVSDAGQLRAFSELAADLLGKGGSSAVLVGHLLKRRRLDGAVQELGQRPEVTVASVLGGPLLPGGRLYMGELTQDEGTRKAVETAEVVVLAGVVLSDLASGMFTHRMDEERTILLDLQQVKVGTAEFHDVQLQDSFAVVAGLLAGRAARMGRDRRESEVAEPAHQVTALSKTADGHRTGSAAVGRRSDRLTQQQLWAALEQWVLPGSIVLADTGTAYYGAAGMDLPPGCELVGQPIWCSIGYTLPALLGTALASPGRPLVLLIGDGAAQLTIQELGTILQHGFDAIIAVLDNGGYTIERLIQNPDAAYHDISPWDWASLPAALGYASPTGSAVVGDLGGLEAALASARGRRGVFLLDVQLRRDDAPGLLRAIIDHLPSAPESPSPAAEMRHTA